MDAAYRNKNRLGLYVFIGLLVLDIVEYFVGSGMTSGSLIPLIWIAVASGYLIIRYYMHIGQLRQKDGH